MSSQRPPPELRCARPTRRRFLQGLVLGLPAAVAMGRSGLALGGTLEQRHLHLINTHTGEARDAHYFVDGVYCPEELDTLNWLLRDHRTSEVLPIETRLLDLLHELAAAAGREPRFEVISGYRSPATNATLVATTNGVSSRSLHMQGRAIDVRLVGLPTPALRDLALARQAGGVGYYPVSDFVHLDTGRVRNWSG
jgi:uncharacterized protein YcbK (DUF882 family)